jgi:chromosome segregation ATPase
MSIFANKKDLEAAKSQIDSLQGDITTLEAELATERETVATQAQSITDLQANFDALATERDNLTASLEAAKNRVAELESAVVTAEQSAEDKAVTLLASAGHEKPLEISEAVETSALETYQQLKKTNPAQATAYWSENKQTIIQQSKH